MKIFTTVTEIQEYIAKSVSSIGFVPTMGALHSGHTSLIALSKLETQITVCSIFVNPTQFNDATDFEKYPRTTEADIAILEEANCDVLFLPSVSEIYPTEWQAPAFDFNPLDTVMEGAFRPGHFAGMAKVVYRLLEIVRPNFLFMGQKDFQQQAIVALMIQQFNINTKLVCAPIIRNNEGLALSSRNTRLSPQNLVAATIIYKTLNEINVIKNKFSVTQFENWAMVNIGKLETVKVEYVSVCNAITLQSVATWEDAPQLVCCVAAWFGDVRLIDNILL